MPAVSHPFAPVPGGDGFTKPDDLTGAMEEGLAGGGGIGAVTEFHFFGGGEELLQGLLGGRREAGALVGEASEEFLGRFEADGIVMPFGEVVFQGLGDGKGEGIGDKLIAAAFEGFELAEGAGGGSAGCDSGIAVSQEKEYELDGPGDKEKGDGEVDEEGPEGTFGLGHDNVVDALGNLGGRCLGESIQG